MENFTKNIEGYKIIKIRYTNLNSEEGNLHTSFDCIDFAINFEMESGYEWNIHFIRSGDFVMESGEFLFNTIHEEQFIQIRDQTSKWTYYTKDPVLKFTPHFVENSNFFTHCVIEFKSRRVISIHVAEKMERKGILPSPLRFGTNNWIYILYSQTKPNWILTKLRLIKSKNLRELIPTIQIKNSSILGFVIVLVVLTLAFLFYYLSEQ